MSPSPPPPIVTTSYLLGNLHCPSCVALIRSHLHSTFGDHVLWVSPNLVTSVVTVEHRDVPAASVRRIEAALQRVGFDVCAVHTNAVAANDSQCDDEHHQHQLPESSSRRAEMHRSTTSVDSWFRFWPRRPEPVSAQERARAAHVENCDECRSGTTHNTTTTLLPDEKADLLRVRTASSETVQGHGLLHSLQRVVTSATNVPTWRLTLSVGGMTCAVCSNTITEELEKNDCISRVVVNLVGNSATVDLSDESRAQAVVDAIEDLGYDAAIDSIVNLQAQQQDSSSDNARDVDIRVDGIFCPRCPERISTTLKSLGPSRLDILQEPSPQNPILKLRYTPDAPRFTIRHILRAIEAADASLKASVHHPPSLEERSKAIRARHQRSLLLREALTVVVAIPTFILGIVYMSLLPKLNPGRMYLMKPWASGLSRLDVALFVLATPVYFFAADVFHVRAVKEMRALWRPGSRVPVAQRFWRFGSMNTLISLGTTIAYVSSVAQMIAAAANSGRDRHEGSDLYFDSVVFLTLFLLAGRLIESYSKSKTGDAVEELGKLRPTTALLLEKDKTGAQVTTTIPIDQLDSGDVVRVPHGASPAADGVVASGESTFDESSLTGESRPIKKTEGDQVFAGTINKGPAITVRATGTSGRSMLDQIVQVVREGQTKRAPIEQIADLLTAYFVPVVTLVAIVTWLTWLGLGYSGALPEHEGRAAGGWVPFALQFAIAVFVVACPCGLGLAAPTAIFVGGGIAARHGILAKGGGEAFEKASRVDCVVFDKTGTLTEGGAPQITDALFFPDSEEEVVDEERREMLMSILKAVEESSSHPIAKAIVAYCGPDTRAAPVEGLEEIPGRGIKAVHTAADAPARLEMLVGNEALMRDVSLPLPPRVASLLETWKSEAKSIALVATKSPSEPTWTLAAALSVSDPIRREARAVVSALSARGTQVWMLSGDNVTTARAVARRVGIPADRVLAEVLPSEKAAQISSLQASLQSGSSSSRRATVAMVGDGINDAPALSTADVGIAIGSGSDVAIGSAAFVLATSRLAAVVTLLDLSRAVFRRIRVNFAWAVVYNALAVPVAAGCLWPVVTARGSHVRLDPVWAALAMALSSISVVLSSLSLRTRVPGVGFRYREVEEEEE